jgi:hypothetical protein
MGIYDLQEAGRGGTDQQVAAGAGRRPVIGDGR